MKIRLQILAVFTLFTSLFVIAGCQSIKTAWDAEHRSATISKLESDAVTVLGRSVFTLLANGGLSNGNLGHTAAQAVWSSIHVGNIAQGIRDAGVDSKLASLAETYVRAEVAKGTQLSVATHVVASAIEAGAMKSL